MYKIILLNIFIILISINLYSQEIKYDTNIEFGYMESRNSIINWPTINRIDYMVEYTQIDFTINYKKLWFKQTILNLFGYSEGLTFDPLEIEYVSELYLKFKILSIGLEHGCLHPVINYYSNENQIARRSSETKLFMRLSFHN